MTESELLIALMHANTPKHLIDEVARKLARKKPEALTPTKEEIDAFERLWEFRRKFTKRPGDPKKPALLAYCRQMRAKPVSVDEIMFAIRSEYGVKKDRPECYAQMVTFMSQGRWETYDYAGYLRSREQREAIAAAPNVTSFRKPEPIDNEARRRSIEQLRGKYSILAVGE